MPIFKENLTYDLGEKMCNLLDYDNQTVNYFLLILGAYISSCDPCQDLKPRGGRLAAGNGVQQQQQLLPPVATCGSKGCPLPGMIFEYSYYDTLNLAFFLK